MRCHGTLLVNGNITVTAQTLDQTVTNNSAAGVSWSTHHDKTTAGAANDVPWSLTVEGRDSAIAAQNYGIYEVVVEDASAGGDDSAWRWRVLSNGAMVSKLLLSGADSALRPAGNAGANALSIGTASFRWQGMHLDNDTEINWMNGSVRLTHNSANDRLEVNAGGLNINGPFSVNGTDFTVTNGTGVVNMRRRIPG